jgi:O-antigen/teichoic acid export membrane protein
VRDDRELLKEAFTKSNRLTLMWGMPFGIALSLFAADLIDFGIGEKWSEALILLQVFGVTQALGHIGFNWSAFYRAVGETRPIALVVAVTALVFCVTAIPLLLVYGLPGYAAGIGAMTLVSLALRGYYVARLFPGFEVFGYVLRALAPTAPAALLVLAVRGLESGPRTLQMAIGELVLYVAVTAALTVWLERSLLREAIGYLRRPRPQADPLPVGV